MPIVPPHVEGASTRRTLPLRLATLAGLVACESSSPIVSTDSTGQADTTSVTATQGTSPDTSEPSSSSTASGPGTQSNSGSGTDDTSTSSPPGCATSDECTDPAAPICIDAACVHCTSHEQCDARDPDAPTCRGDGHCVACTPIHSAACSGNTPVCNPNTSACEPCSFHIQCPDSACDIQTGACFTDDCIVDVDGDGGANYYDIQDSLADGCVVRVHELGDGGGAYFETLLVNGFTVAILAADAETPLVQGGDGNPSLALTNGAVAYVQGITFRNSMAAGITASSASLYLDQSFVVNNSGGGILLSNGAAGSLRNSFIGVNGNGSPTARGLHVNASTLDVVYSTIARNDAGLDDSLLCNLTSTVTVRNSILIGRDSPSINCTPLTASFSVFDEAVAGAGNETVAAINNSWFVDVFTGNLHLTGAGETQFSDVAQWEAGDPPTDIDGEPRPTDPGSADVAGADVP
jgi:hypothetical protein